MIKITVGPGTTGPHPTVSFTHHATGEKLTGARPLYRTRRTGRWAGTAYGTAYFTPDDREHLLNEARQFADGFMAGVEYARSQVSRVDDKQPLVTYEVAAPYAVRHHEESLRRANTNL